MKGFFEPTKEAFAGFPSARTIVKALPAQSGAAAGA